MHILRAGRCVAAGGLIAYPTEAVYGLGCDPWNETAVLRLLRLKRRKLDKGLIVVAADPAQIADLADFSGLHNRAEILASWPGPVTWLLPAYAHTPVWLTGGHTTLAVRIPDHELVQRLCSSCGPLVSTSANPAAAAPARTPQRVRAYFGCQLDCILPGKTDENRRPSPIRDALSGELVRA
ncbi:MAG: Sua5/YciO/YrdC/YwlC family protein [Gammaproteobacteria bacterium]